MPPQITKTTLTDADVPEIDAGPTEMIHRAREPYIADNPFRLVGSGSALTQQQLRRKIEAASRSATVGLKTSPPLDAEFASDDIEDLMASVRSLATIPIRRTAYRIMWPLSEHAIPYILNTPPPSTNTLLPEEVTQLTFLSAWYAFLRNNSPSQVAQALDNWIDLYNDSAMDNHLKALITEDDNLSDSDAYDCLLEAQEQIAQHLLRKTASVAAQEWEKGNTEAAIRIVEALLNSTLDETMQAEALEPMIEIGQSLTQKVQRITLDLLPYTLGACTDPPREVIQLERMSSTLTNRHPMAGRWADTVQDWYAAFGWKMRGAALELNKQNDDEGALTIVEEALKIVRDVEIKDRLLEDRTTLKQILVEKERNKPYAEVEPISDAPTLRTINGIGTALYGSVQFPADQRLRYSILYFVVFYIPVFPLARYVVEPAGHNQWRFFGTTKWTQAMKVHLAVACTIALFGIIAICLSSGTPVSSYTSYENSSTPIPTTVPETGGNTSDNTSPAYGETDKTLSKEGASGSSSGKIDDEHITPREQHRQHLEQQLTDWKTKIQSAKTEMASDDQILDQERTALEALKARIAQVNPDTQVQQEIDDYNAMVRSYEAQRRNFNDHVERHNSKLEASRDAVRQYNAIADQLNMDR